MNNGFYTPELGQDKPDRIIDDSLTVSAWIAKAKLAEINGNYFL